MGTYTDLEWVKDGRAVSAVVTETVSADDGVTEVKEVVLFSDVRVLNGLGHRQLDPRVVRLTLVPTYEGNVVDVGAEFDDLQLWVNGAYEFREDYPALLGVFDDLSAVAGRIQQLPIF